METHKEFLLRRKCWRKRSYSTGTKAHKSIRKAWAERRVRLYKYKCSDCGEYHLTSQESGKNKVL